MRQDSCCETFSPLRDENVEQTIIPNLTPYTKYEVLVNPFNKIGPGPASSKAIVSTLEGGKWRPGQVISSLCRYIELSWVSVPGGAPQLVHCDPISPSSVSISWKAPPVEMRNGIILGYLITYRLENKIGGETQLDTLKATLLF